MAQSKFRYILFLPILAIIFFLLWYKQYYFDRNPIKGSEYKIILHRNGEEIPYWQKALRIEQIYELDSITLRNEYETVNEIQRWEMVVVENKTTHFKALMETNDISSNVFDEIKKLNEPGAIFMTAHTWSTNQADPKAEMKRIDIIH